MSTHIHENATEVLKTLRRQMRWSQVELAKRSGLSTGKIAMAELGQINLGIEALSMIADAYSMKPETLLTALLTGVAPEIAQQPQPATAAA